MPREVVCIGCGQCGLESNAQFFQQIAVEHGLNPQTGASSPEPLEAHQVTRRGTYFRECEGGFRPRSLFADLDPETMDDLRLGPSAKMLSQCSLVSGKTGGDGVWPKGYYLEGKETMLDPALETIRKEVEACDQLQGFQVVHALGGGTSGFASLLLENLSSEDEFRGAKVLTFSATPSRKDPVLEPYNSMLSLSCLAEHSDMTILLEGNTLLDKCYKTLKLNTPTSVDMGYLIASTMTGVTSSLRYPGQLNANFDRMMSALFPSQSGVNGRLGVPPWHLCQGYGRGLHFLVAGIAPTALRGQQAPDLNTTELTRQLLSKESLMCAVEPSESEWIAASMQLRGPASMKEVDETVSGLRKAASVCEDLKVSLCSTSSPLNKSPKLSGSFLGHTAAITEVLERAVADFEKLYRKESYVDTFFNLGMEQMEFNEAAEKIRDIIKDYSCSAEGGDGEEEGEEEY